MFSIIISACVGMFIGTLFGIFIMCLCRISAQADIISAKIIDKQN